ncbi:tyrosine-type recombinase/integrase [Saccharothrix coeruleofusca]|uniref:Site-specific integrase n=1 Tax=Saccharothrix coeruleofusca TaxID=33919 RepID=A0A918EAR9_9PSEU|nr:site-specific integrase [Saccharothrix coeruleofusca]GGP36041.1 site-specific integrase [Saccharothrix coeruleofusca]
MAKRRSRGDGGIHWDEKRERYIATLHVGYKPDGKRITKQRSAKTMTEAKRKLRELQRELEDGGTIAPHGYTVGEAVTDWLTNYAATGRDPNTVRARRVLAEQHVIPALGARKLVELTAEDVDSWLIGKAQTLSTATLRDIRSILKRSVSRAQARDKVKRNVVLLCDCPVGQPGRPSKALTLAQAEALLAAAENTPMRGYIVVALLSGARTEELRALTWSNVDLLGDDTGPIPVPPNVKVWRSVRASGDTKTRKSRRSLALPQRCVEALKDQQARQSSLREAAGDAWQEHDLVFTTKVGTALDDANVRRDFRRVVKTAGLKPEDWTPRELRHSFVSLLSDSGVPIEQISRLVGHSGTFVTELVYRKQIRPVVQEGATAMDRIFPTAGA